MASKNMCGRPKNESAKAGCSVFTRTTCEATARTWAGHGLHRRATRPSTVGHRRRRSEKRSIVVPSVKVDRSMRAVGLGFFCFATPLRNPATAPRGNGQGQQRSRYNQGLHIFPVGSRIPFWDTWRNHIGAPSRAGRRVPFGDKLEKTT